MHAEDTRRTRPPTVSPGDRFGRLFVAGYADTVGGKRRYLCYCDCGSEKVIRGGNLLSGNTTSCGCAFREELRARNHDLVTIHGHATGRVSPTYRSWQAMIARCSRPTHVGYHNYGGRGIAICERWLTFANFLADMGERPTDRTLDRIDNDGDYEPYNCRWATHSEQRRNQRSGARREQRP